MTLVTTAQLPSIHWLGSSTSQPFPYPHESLCLTPKRWVWGSESCSTNISSVSSKIPHPPISPQDLLSAPRISPPLVPLLPHGSRPSERPASKPDLSCITYRSSLSQRLTKARADGTTQVRDTA